MFLSHLMSFTASCRFYTKHHLKFGKNQADNLEYIGFRRRFFPVFYWCLVLERGYTEEDVGKASPSDMELYYSKEQQAQYGVVGIKIALQK